MKRDYYLAHLRTQNNIRQIMTTQQPMNSVRIALCELEEEPVEEQQTAVMEGGVGGRDRARLGAGRR